jgi:hypothetical protein
MDNLFLKGLPPMASNTFAGMTSTGVTIAFLLLKKFDIYSNYCFEKADVTLINVSFLDDICPFGDAVAQDTPQQVESFHQTMIRQDIFDIHSLSGGRDQIAVTQDLKVAGGGWLRDGERSGKIVDRVRLVG